MYKTGDMVVVAICGVLVLMHAAIGYAEVKKDNPEQLPEITNDTRLKSGLNDKACVANFVPPRHVRGIRTPYGAYCLEEGDTPDRIQAFPTDKDYHDPRSGERGRKLSLQELLQIMVAAQLVQQLDALEGVKKILAGLEEAIRKDLKAWQRESLDNVTTRLEKFPTSVASNADVIKAVKEAAIGQLATDPAFISAVKAGLADGK